MMLIEYISASILFLAAGYLILRVNFRHDYRHHGHLSIFSTVAGTILFFIWGAFPYIYGPKDWPDVHLPFLLEMLGWTYPVIPKFINFQLKILKNYYKE